MKRNSKCPILAAMFCCAIGAASRVPALDVDNASWYCGPYSETNVPVGLGSVIKASYVNVSEDLLGVTTDTWDAQLVFSLKGFTYDESGNVLGTETVVRPSAQVVAESSWTAGTFPDGIGTGAAGTACSVTYYGRITPLPGAPEGALVPLKVRLLGHASAYNSRTNSNPDANWPTSYARAYSTFSALGVDTITGYAVADVDHPFKEYDIAVIATNFPSQVFAATVFAEAYANIHTGYPFSSSIGQAQAFADPSIEIDSAYPFKSLFSLEFSTNILFTPADPGPRLSVTRDAGGIRTVSLTGFTNHVYEMQTETNCFPQNWQVLALVTNVSGTVNYTDTTSPTNKQRFYRARVVKVVQ